MGSSKPRLLITMGDPAGVGPELCVQAIADSVTSSIADLVLVGDRSVLDEASRVARVDLSYLKTYSRGYLVNGRIPNGPAVVDLSQESPGPFPKGKISATGGRASHAYLMAAIEATRQRYAAAIVTAPINKESLHLAAIPFPGHTEILTEATGCTDSGMMLTSPTITCSLVTTHVSLAAVPKMLDVERILRLIRLTDRAMRRINQTEKPHLVVLGLNPHAGEGGLFGDEEQRIIAPAVAAARLEGLDVEGPLPPDTAFLPKIRARTDAFVCMYHDQGLIPLKALAFDSAVNVTLGLPIVRTSVDHGTAYDIAWTNQVDFASMRAAIQLAVRLVD